MKIVTSEETIVWVDEDGHHHPLVKIKHEYGWIPDTKEDGWRYTLFTDVIKDAWGKMEYYDHDEAVQKATEWAGILIEVEQANWNLKSSSYKAKYYNTSLYKEQNV